MISCFFFFSSRRRHTRLQGDWSSDVCSSDLWDPSTASEGPHTLTAVARNDAGNMTTSEPVTVTVSHAPPPPPPATFAPGDVFVSLETGSVQWRSPDGTLHAELVGQVPGAAEGIRFDATGNLYVTH